MCFFQGNLNSLASSDLFQLPKAAVHMVHESAFRLVISLMLEAIIDSNLKLDMVYWLLIYLYGGRRLKLMVIYSVFGTLMTRPSYSAETAVLVSCFWAFGIYGRWWLEQRNVVSKIQIILGFGRVSLWLTMAGRYTWFNMFNVLSNLFSSSGSRLDYVIVLFSFPFLSVFYMSLQMSNVDSLWKY